FPPSRPGLQRLQDEHPASGRDRHPQLPARRQEGHRNSLLRAAITPAQNVSRDLTDTPNGRPWRTSATRETTAQQERSAAWQPSPARGDSCPPAEAGRTPPGGRQSPRGPAAGQRELNLGLAGAEGSMSGGR